MLTGEVGAGKTTVSRKFLAQLAGEHYQVVTLTNPSLSADDLIRALLLNLAEPADGDSKSLLLERLRSRLQRNYELGIDTVVVVDEAHVIQRPETFEELRLLLNLQSEDRFLVTLILLGQPPLLKKIAAIQPLRERIGIKYHLAPLDREDTLRYIMFRLKRAGSDRGIFTREAIEAVYDFSRGIPLRSNSICDRSLIVGMMRDSRVVNSGVVREAIADLE